MKRYNRENQGIKKTQRLDGILLTSNPFERPTQIFSDFKKISALGQTIQKINLWGVVPPN